jgi:hypothetical protein
MTSKIRVLHIDPIARTVVEKLIGNDLATLQALVEGYIEVAFRFPNGDVLYVNDEGRMRSDWTEFGAIFALSNSAVFVGPGVIVGTGDDGDTVSAATALDGFQVFFRLGDA